MTEQEQKAFDLMREALHQVLLCVPNVQKLVILEALASAKASQQK